MKKILRSKKELMHNNNEMAVLYMRIVSRDFQELNEQVVVNNQYYKEVNGKLVQVLIDPTIVTYDELDQLIAGVLTKDQKLMDSASQEVAFLIGSMVKIEQSNMFGSVASDWEMIDVPDDRHLTKTFG